VGTSGPSDERTDCPDGTENDGPGFWFEESGRKEMGGAAFWAGAKEPKTLSKSLCGPSRANPEGDMVFSVGGAGDLRKKGLVL
jgi:hypothetical protein